MFDGLFKIAASQGSQTSEMAFARRRNGNMCRFRVTTVLMYMRRRKPGEILDTELARVSPYGKGPDECSSSNSSILVKSTVFVEAALRLPEIARICIVSA